MSLGRYDHLVVGAGALGAATAYVLAVYQGESGLVDIRKATATHLRLARQAGAELGVVNLKSGSDRLDLHLSMKLARLTGPAASS